MTDQPHRPYPIGYGKPPRETRFKPGQSGNPAGRRPLAKNFATAMDEALSATVRVTKDGRRCMLSKRELIAHGLVARATAGELRPAELLINQERLHEKTPGLGSIEDIFDGSEEQPVLDGIVQRIRAGLEIPASPNPASEPTAADANPDKAAGSDQC